MKHFSRTRIPGFLGLAALLLASCGKQGGTATPPAASSAQGSRSAMEATEAKAPAEVSAVKPQSDPSNARNAPQAAAKETPKAPAAYQGGLEKLETGYDLSKVELDKKDAVDDGHDHDHDAQPGAELLPAAQAERNKGRISMADGNQVHDFGRLRQGEAAAHEFQLVSDGEEPLIVTGIKPSCGCTKAEILLLGAEGTHQPYTKGDPIPTGTRFLVQTEINTDGRQGPFSAQISVYANDARGVFTLRLAAEVEPVLTVEPSPTVFFGKITTADTKEQTITVASTQGEKFRLTAAQETLPEPLQIEYTAKLPDEEGKSSEWNIKIALGPNAEIGMRNYPIHFKSDIPIAHPKYPSQDGSPQFQGVMINVQAQVTGMVSAEPSFLTFGMVRPGEPVERALRIESHDSFLITGDVPVVFEGLQGQEFPFKDAFKVAVEPVDGGKAADVKVRLESFPEGLNGSFSGVLKLKIGHPFMDELMVRFSGVCRPTLPATGGQPEAATGGG